MVNFLESPDLLMGEGIKMNKDINPAASPSMKGLGSWIYLISGRWSASLILSQNKGSEPVYATRIAVQLSLNPQSISGADSFVLSVKAAL
jgi:hypothetical protein